jgi:hypothetical protein
VLKLTLVAFLALTTCAFLFGPDLPDGSEHFTPPEAYREIWAEAQKCTEREGDFDRLQWYIVPGHDFPCPSGRCIGEWIPPHGIAIAEEWKTTAWVIKHEMVHDLTGWSHDRGPRDRWMWGERCRATWGWLPQDSTYKP